ncbi:MULTISPECIES: DUF2079 domain-containing protein [unclassified Fusibacter]|uniref:DUF2079 domain-containing protein n=1 Tax=unclassified Fusibacter TaxID=2624464 RepID=UPI00101325CD|nr:MULTISPECIES: DUF2079 domain-containing protein [unclassified Fusibacter]MCK8061460.1 DUF2079 domain-containing protein [Fusibacter sp. A2]NPE23647.1 DUF2079 domain-containing protein [Fusibacter sp. A1]RXV58919.1 DUF2079 domain-containing protein [Fusibacter sp. A1]
MENIVVAKEAEAHQNSVHSERKFDAFRRYNYKELLLMLFSSYIFASIVSMINVVEKNSNLSFVTNLNGFSIIISMMLYLAVVIYMKLKLKISESVYLGLVVVSGCFGVLTVVDSEKNIFLTLGVIGIMSVIIISYYQNVDINKFERVNNKVTSAIIGLLFMVMFYMISTATIFRYKTYNASTYDFGIFTQMFHYMKQTGLPYTTLERNVFLSHFAIHFSPIYYLILPGYLLFSSPEYLLIVQAFFVTSGVIPLYLLCRHQNLNTFITMLISGCYLFYPGIVSPTFYDFHENKFLTALMLWMLYFYEKNKKKSMILLVFLVLFVKEDAALYIIFFGFYDLFANKNIRQGLIITCIGFIYFYLVTTGMSLYGYGIMDDRFSVYQLPNETGLAVVMKNILMNPGFFITQVFMLEKLKFALYMLTPLVFIPIISSKWSNLIFLIPMLVINLMPKYVYQYDIGFQYTYGVSAIMFFLFIKNISKFEYRKQLTICSIGIFASLVLLMTATNDKFSYYQNIYNTFSQEIVRTDEALSLIPRNASITSETFFTPHLYYVQELYEYPNDFETDYLVLDVRCPVEKFDEKSNSALNAGYVEVFSGGMAVVYKKIDNPLE